MTEKKEFCPTRDRLFSSLERWGDTSRFLQKFDGKVCDWCQEYWEIIALDYNTATPDLSFCEDNATSVLKERGESEERIKEFLECYNKLHYNITEPEFARLCSVDFGDGNLDFITWENYESTAIHYLFDRFNEEIKERERKEWVVEQVEELEAWAEDLKLDIWKNKSKSSFSTYLRIENEEGEEVTIRISDHPSKGNCSQEYNIFCEAPHQRKMGKDFYEEYLFSSCEGDSLENAIEAIKELVESEENED